MYVGDVVAAVNRAIEFSILGRYSVASKNVVSIRTLVSMVEEAFGRTVEVKWTDPDGVPEPPIPSLYPSLPDWSPTWTLEQGLRELRDSLQ
jgi:nucleoside-diphosphate-sugar epimerase